MFLAIQEWETMVRHLGKLAWLWHDDERLSMRQVHDIQRIMREQPIASVVAIYIVYPEWKFILFGVVLDFLLPTSHIKTRSELGGASRK